MNTRLEVRSTGTMEHRTAHGVRKAARAGLFDARAVTYNVVDMFGSVWLPGCFTDWLNRSRVTILYGHDSDGRAAEPIGKSTGWSDTTVGPVVTFKLDTSPDVPRARQAAAQLDSGTMDEFSVGFRCPPGGKRRPTPDDEKRWPNVREVISKAEMSHLALVYEGAVPGAKLLAIRSTAQQMARDLTDGRITPSQYRAWREMQVDLDEVDRAIDLGRAAAHRNPYEGVRLTPTQARAAIAAYRKRHGQVDPPPKPEKPYVPTEPSYWFGIES